MEKVILERTNIFIPIGIAIGPLTVEQILFELTNIFVAIAIDIGAIPLQQVVDKRPGVSVATGNKTQTALTIEKITFERSRIFVTIGIGIAALPRLDAIFERPRICVAIDKAVRPLAIWQVITKGTDVCITARIGIAARAAQTVILEFANIGIARKPRFRAPGFAALAGLDTSLKGTLINVTICRDQPSLAMEKVVFKVPNVFRTIRIGERALTTLLVLLEVSNIDIAIGKAVGALTSL